MDRSPGGDPPPPLRIAEADAAGHDPPLVAGYPQNLERLLGVEEAEDDGEGTADPVGPGGQLGAPDGRVDRTAGGVGLHEPEEEEGNLLEVIGQLDGDSLLQALAVALLVTSGS